MSGGPDLLYVRGRPVLLDAVGRLALRRAVAPLLLGAGRAVDLHELAEVDVGPERILDRVHVDPEPVCRDLP